MVYIVEKLSALQYWDSSSCLADDNKRRQSGVQPRGNAAARGVEGGVA